jgi:hypothetical protein
MVLGLRAKDLPGVAEGAVQAEDEGSEEQTGPGGTLRQSEVWVDEPARNVDKK